MSNLVSQKGRVQTEVVSRSQTLVNSTAQEDANHVAPEFMEGSECQWPRLPRGEWSASRSLAPNLPKLLTNLPA